MSEETKPIEQSYNYQVDQQVSINGFFDVDINGETARFQITNRYGATPEKITKTVKAAIDAFAMLRQEFPRTVAAPAVVPQVTRQPIDDNGNDLPEVKTAIAGRLSVEMKDNKYYFKVADAIFGTGEKGTKYGIPVYPEVLKAAGLDVREGQPMPDIANWKVNYICNEKGYPSKVTRLLPPK